MAPANQLVQEEMSLDVNDDEQLGGLMAQLVLAKQATFDKPAKNRHMRSLYLKGYVNGKPLTKMFVDGGAAVNVKPYTTFRKLVMGPGDLTPTSIILNDFAWNPSDTKGCVHMDLMIGSKTLLTIFFVIEGKGAYSLLLGRDWIHANCCIPSTMHQQIIQWVDYDIEVVQADDSVSDANVDQLSGNINASIVSQGKTGEKVLLSLSAVINSRFKQSALIVIFNRQSCRWN
jgi:hypothetical protein